MSEEEKRTVLSAVALRGLTILPGMIIHFDLSRVASIVAVEKALAGGEEIFLVTQLNPEVEEPGYEDVYRVGTIAGIRQISKLPGNIIRVLVEGRARAYLHSLSLQEEKYLQAQVTEWETDESAIDALTLGAMKRQLKEMLEEYRMYYPKVGGNLEKQFLLPQSVEKLIDLTAMSLPLEYPQKQMVLETQNLRERYFYLVRILHQEIEMSRIKAELNKRVKSGIESKQKEFILREQLSQIREELGESDSDGDQFDEALEALEAKPEVKEKIRKEIERFRSLHPSNAESAVERTYIENLLDMPWDKTSEDSNDLAEAERILQEQHYGLEKVKERILEFLAVRCLTNRGESPIICLVGPPGTGKTSIARSVAEALHKKYVRISLGGVRDEAEIRGHRRTYVGAMPGRIAEALRQAGVKNPLMLLDEIDKVSSDYKGDTASALLEVLDGEQNCRFRDHYIEIPLDLSEVLFIATANTTATIPSPLLDRMEIIEVNSYTANEKFHIAKEHLVAKVWQRNGLTPEQLSISDNALRQIIDGYTREAGVRSLERMLGEICRKSAREFLKAPGKQIRITGQNLVRYLGNPRYQTDQRDLTDEVGIVRGLAWTSVGGETLQIEVNMMPGRGDIDLTGQMGDVMKESALTGMSYVRSISKKYQISADTYRKNDFHIHIPEGAVPKDGPSAGITMATALVSAVIGIPVYAEVAMTGEITLRGRVLPIGGLKEKLLAAKKAGMKKVLIPEENRRDLEEISREIKNGMEIVPVKNMAQVLEHALTRQPQVKQRKKKETGDKDGYQAG